MNLLRIDPVAPEPEVIERASAILKRGGLVAFPTETVYGLGANALDEAAVLGIFAAKRRALDDPLIVHLASVDDLPTIVTEIPPVAHALAERFWPGPLTLVVPTDEGPTLGIRWPASPFVAAVAAEVGPGKTVAVVGDGAVGLLGVLAAKQLGAARIIAMSRHEPRQRLAREFGATDIVVERGNEGVARIQELTGGLGAHSVLEAVGTQESMMQAIHATRPGGHVGYVGVTHEVALPGMELFFSHVHLHGGPAPVRRFLPELIDLIWTRQIDPGKVFDLELPLDQAPEAYTAMDERRAIKVLLRP
jgi:hypothetical protein